jgi:KDO2-lipid IV(A) lauroyltransferase
MAILYRIALHFMAALPMAALHALGALAGLCLWWLPTQQRRSAQINLALCLPHLSERKRRRIARASLFHFGRALAESPRLWLGPPRAVQSLARESRGEEHVHAALEAGRGLILVTPHLGAWEMTGLYCSRIRPLTSLYKPQKGFADTVIKAGRERFGARLVPSDGGGVRALLRALKRGEMVGVLPDQDPPRGSGLFAPFFGVAAHTPNLVPRLAERTAAPVIYTYAERLPRARGYRLHFLPAPEDIAARDRTRAASALNEGVAACIIRLPEQYWWSYQRFRRRPPGQDRPYP